VSSSDASRSVLPIPERQHVGLTTYDAKDPGVDGDQVGEGRAEATVPMLYSADETCDVGYDSGTPVSEDYTSQNGHFNGKVKWVQLDASLEDHDHLITPEERLRVATAIK
jgi:hypothetical protein